MLIVTRNNTESNEGGVSESIGFLHYIQYRNCRYRACNTLRLSHAAPATGGC